MVEKVTTDEGTGTETTPYDSGKLVNGGFADVVANYTGDYNASADGKAAAWQYYSGWKTNEVATTTAPKTELIENGIKIISDGSNKTDTLSERITIQQTVSGLDSTKSYTLTVSYNISEYNNYGNFSIGVDANDNVVSAQTAVTDGWKTIEYELSGKTSAQIRICTSANAKLTASVKEFKLVETEQPQITYEASGFIQNYKYATEDINTINSWSYYPNNVLSAGNATVSVADGAISATLNNTSNININQTIKLTNTSDYGKYYLVTGKIKTESLSSNAYLRVQLLKADYTTAHSNYMWTSTKYKNTNDWQDVSVVVPVPASIGNVTIGGFKVEQIIDKGTGTASFKDLKAVATEYTYDSSNLIINPDYVNSGDLSSLTPWTYYPNDVLTAAKATVAVDNDEFSATLKGSSNINLYQTVKLDTAVSDNFGYYYKITGDIKTSDLSGNAYLRAQLVNSSNGQISSGRYTWTSAKSTKYSDWTTVTMYIPVPANAENVAVAGFKVEQIADRGTGTVSFKNLKVEKTTIALDDNILKNAAFLCGNASDITAWAYSPVGKLGSTYDADVSNKEFTLTAKNTTENMVLYQKVVTGTSEVPEDTIYKLTGKMKATDFAGSALIRVRLDDEAGGSLAVVKQSPTVTESTNGWVDVEYQFEVPSKYYKNATDENPTAVGDFKVELYVGKGNAELATGSVSFKDIEVTKVSDINNNVVTGEADNTLFSNGGFERTYDGLPRWWSVWESTGGLKVSSDRTVYHNDGENYTGSASLHIENVTEGKESRGSVHQTITDIPEELQGQSVKISQWIKASNFTGTGFTIRLQYKTNSGAAVDLTSKYVSIPENEEDTGWQLYEYILDLPSNDLKQIKLEYLYDECVGDVWVDDLSVTTYIKATGITPSEESVILNVGGTKQLTQTLSPANATITGVSYTSSNAEVATVSAAGLITAVKEGTATVKVSHVDGAEKEIAVLVANETFYFNETIAPISTQAGVAATGTLPTGYTYTVAAKPQYGAFVINGTNYNYYPDAGFTGNDTVVLAVENANGAKTLVKVEITVGAASEAPVFDDFIIATSKNTPVTGGMVATDATTPSNQLVFTLTKAPSKGTLTISGDSYTYTPETGFDGYVTAADGKPVEVTVTDKDNNKTTAEVTIYVSESQEEIAGSVKDFVSATHRGSYLLADDAKFESIARYALQSGSEIADWLQDVKAEVDPLLDDTVPFPAYQCSDGVRLDTQGSKDVVNLAFMYRVTKAMNDELVSQGKTVDRTLEKQYLNRAWMELENLCNPTKFRDWHPSHLLDVAMTANGVAIAYDWLYDYLESAEKTHSVPDVSNKIAYVESALYKNALVEGKFQYEDDHMFVTNGFNWNYVCNGGFATAALALMHCNNAEYEALAAEVLQLAYKSIQNGLPQYAPEGDSIEGVSYWDYGTRYLVSFLACVKSATGNNPFSDTPGLKETALYPIYLTGKDGSFNYSDNDTADAVGYLNLWLAEAYDEPSYAWYHKYYMSQNHKACIYDLLYYNAQYYNSDATPALDSYYSAQAVTTMRKDYTDANSAFVGFKGGITGAPHGDLDIGTFIYDIYGIRWAADLGKENYNMGDYWNLNSGSLRWGYYRKDASGHNTLVINPKSTGENQKIGTYTGAVETKLNGTAGGYTILDMTPAYQNEAASVKRGVAFINRSQVLVRDEYILKSAGEIYWQMHTEADISISADGKIATLTQDGKSIEIRILDDSSNLKFETMAAGYYDKSSEADTRVDASNAATGSADKIEKGRGLYKKLYIKASDVQTGSFSVLLTPADEVNPEVKVLADWSAYDFSKFVNNKKPTGGEAAPPEADPGDSSSSDDKKEDADKDDKDSTDSTGSTLVETVPAPQKPAENTATNTSGTKTEDTDVTDEKEEAPVEEKNEVVLETEITVEDNVAVVETPSEEALEEILGDKTEADVIVIDVTKEAKDATVVELPVDLIEAIAEAAADEDNTVDSLAIKLPVGTVTIDAKTLSALVEQAEGDSIRLVLEKDTEHRLNEKQTKAVADYEVHEFIEAYFICTKTEKRISDFKGGVAILSIPFEIPAGKVAKGFKVWYVDDEGGMEELVTWHEDGHLFWEVGHFSDFVIIFDETAEAVEDSVVVDTESADGATIEEPAESAGFPWWIIAVVAVVVVIVFVLKRKKDEDFED